MKKKRSSPLLSILVLVLSVYAFVTLLNVGLKLRQARQTLAEEQAAAEQLRQENIALQYGIDHADEKENLESIAREILGLVYPDETVVYNVGN